MTAAVVTYIVSAYDSKAKTWKTLLSTKDKPQADAMVAAMEQDGTKARVEVFPGGEGLSRNGSKFP